LQSAIILNDYFDGSFSIPVDDFLPFFFYLSPPILNEGKRDREK
jgi:hypothetical protein